MPSSDGRHPAGRGGDRRERERAAVAHRAYLWELTAARQAAGRARGVRSRDPAVRRATEAVYQRGVARIAAWHQAWLREHPEHT